jgi:predicted XRE-type DNA-binding protein
MLGIPQPRVSELMTGKVDKFPADKLIGFCAKANPHGKSPRRKDCGH